jgi:hypothetical protein
LRKKSQLSETGRTKAGWDENTDNVDALVTSLRLVGPKWGIRNGHGERFGPLTALRQSLTNAGARVESVGV